METHEVAFACQSGCTWLRQMRCDHHWMRSFSRWALAGLVAIVAGGCGTVMNRSNVTVTAPGRSIVSYAQVAEGSCSTGGVNGKPVKTSCVFTLADGRRFTCPQRFAQVVQTAGSLERATACRSIAPLHLSVAVRRVTASIESTQACLTSHSVREIGNAVLPPLANANSPDGELIAGYLPNGALIAFYRDIANSDSQTANRHLFGCSGELEA